MSLWDDMHAIEAEGGETKYVPAGWQRQRVEVAEIKTTTSKDGRNYFILVVKRGIDEYQWVTAISQWSKKDVKALFQALYPAGVPEGAYSAAEEAAQPERGKFVIVSSALRPSANNPEGFTKLFFYADSTGAAPAPAQGWGPPDGGGDPIPF